MGYAQAGYGQFGGDSGYGTRWATFGQYTDACVATGDCELGPDTVETTFKQAPPTGGAWSYTARSEPGDGLIHMYAAGTNVDLGYTYYDPESYWGAQWWVEYSAETHQTETDVVGTSGDYAHFYNLRYTDSSTTLHYTTAQLYPLYPGYTRYHNVFYTPSIGQGISVWTNPL